MSSPNSASYVLNKYRNLVQCFTGGMRLQYYRYEVTFGLYVMTPREKLVVNTFVIVIPSLFFWAVLLYIRSLR
jgi:Small subunit of serine palmitoyltransferase-like